MIPDNKVNLAVAVTTLVTLGAAAYWVDTRNDTPVNTAKNSPEEARSAVRSEGRTFSSKAASARRDRLLNKSRKGLFSDPEDLAQKDWKTLDATDTNDKEATEAFIQRYAVSPGHAEGLRKQNKYVLRREMIKQDQTFTDLGKRILNGEKVKRIVIPGIDGEAIPVQIKNTSDVVAEHQGSIIGVVEGEPNSSAVITYYKGMMSGYISTMKGGGRTLIYDPHSPDQLVVKEIDILAMGLDSPCSCTACATNHNELVNEFGYEIEGAVPVEVIPGRPHPKNTSSPVK